VVGCTPLPHPGKEVSRTTLGQEGDNGEGEAQSTIDRPGFVEEKEE